MTKAQIHFSNSIGELANVLRKELFPEGSQPFEKRLVIVPHMGLKAYLMQRFARDPQLQIAAGIQIVDLNQGYAKITQKNLPTQLELSLFLEHELLTMIDEEEELKTYFGNEAKDRRIGPFCDVLAASFLQYKIYGKHLLPPWQEKLFQKLPWVFPRDYRGKKGSWHIHLFGFTFLPKSYLEFFRKHDAQMYLFSPCEIFWEDFYSEKEKFKQQLDLFHLDIEDQNPLLVSWGKVGRELQRLTEDFQTKEYYAETEERNGLEILQNALLRGNVDRPKVDGSMRWFSAPTPFREVEILKEHLLELFEKGEICPSDVHIFAPNINDYAPFIKAIFDDVPISMSNLDFALVDPVVKGFDLLIKLPQNRFSADEVIQVLAHTKFKFDLGVVRKWIEAANVRWGFSKEQRRALYLQDAEEDQIKVESFEGTWQEGLNRLVLGLGQIDQKALPLISNTEMEDFNRLYTIIDHLAEDLAPFFDQTKWTIPTWLRYFACLLESYFSIDPDHDLYKQFLDLASRCDHLDQHEIPFEGIQRVLLQRKKKTQSASNLEAIHFGSFSEGVIQPKKVIGILGMQEEAFPRYEEKKSLDYGTHDYIPNRSDSDRYLFLQALISAKSHFLASYVDDGEGKLGASILIEELLGQIEGGKVIHHPSQFAKEAVEELPPKKPPLIQGFYQPIELEIPKEISKEIDLAKLFKFARHPLRYYFHQVLGIYPQFDKEDQRDYLLDPLTKSQIVKKTLQEEDVDHHLPLNLLRPLAKKQIAKEVDQWKEAMAFFGVDQFESKKVELQVGPYILKGTLEFFTDKGLLAWGKNTFEDKIRFWSASLLMEKMGLPLLFIKDQSVCEVMGSLENYIEYFLKAHLHPSPMQPDLAKALLSKEGLEKGLKQVDDEIWKYLLIKDPMPHAEMIHRNWDEELEKVFGGAHAIL